MSCLNHCSSFFSPFFLQAFIFSFGHQGEKSVLFGSGCLPATLSTAPCLNCAPFTSADVSDRPRRDCRLSPSPRPENLSPEMSKTCCGTVHASFVSVDRTCKEETRVSPHWLKSASLSFSLGISKWADLLCSLTLS